MKLAALVLAFAVAPAAAQMYKCTDEQGRVQYTDKPSPGCREVAIQASPPISGTLSPPTEDVAGDEAQFRKRQLDRDAATNKERQAQLERCAQLRDEQNFLGAARRVMRMNEKGEPTILEDAAREQRLADIRRELARCP